MPIEPVSCAASSDSTSPNRLSVTITSILLGIAHQLHGAIVGQHMGELDIGKFRLCTSVTTSRHKHARHHHIGFLRRGDALAAQPRQLERDARDAVDLAGRIDLRVDGALLAVRQGGGFLGLAEINPARQFAHDQDVEARDDLRLQAWRHPSAHRSTAPGADWRTAPDPCAGAASRARASASKGSRPIAARRPRRTARHRPSSLSRWSHRDRNGRVFSKAMPPTRASSIVEREIAVLADTSPARAASRPSLRARCRRPASGEYCACLSIRSRAPARLAAAFRRRKSCPRRAGSGRYRPSH